MIIKSMTIKRVAIKKLSVKQKTSQQRQKGFVLVLALVLLAVLTLIGVSSMNSANMELRATANTKQHALAFNSVQSVIEFVLSSDADVNFQTDSLTTQNIVVSTVITDLGGQAKDLEADVNFAGCSIGVGSSMQKNKGFSYNFYEVTASGKNATGTASSEQMQGIRYPSASC